MSGRKTGMSPDEASALADIKGYAHANRVQVARRHGPLRMGQRNAQYGDIISALCTATNCELQKNGRWNVSGGCDLDGDELTLIVVLDDGVLVVTLF